MKSLLRYRTIRIEGNYFMVQIGFQELQEALEDMGSGKLKELLLDIKECMYQKMLEQEGKKK